MFIKEIKKKNKGYEKVFIYHRLMESYRTERGPRQRTVLNLGKLDLHRKQWKLLADKIEEKTTGQQSLIECDEYIESLATHYANLIIHKTLDGKKIVDEKADAPEYETVDIKSVKNSRSRTIGAEYVGLSMFKRLGLDILFQRLGFNKDQINLAALSIIGRLVHPASERKTRVWAQSSTGLDELLGTDFKNLSNNALYRILDLLFSHKKRIEKHLRLRERDLFSLNEKIILYDLTNTYFEGDAQKNPKAKRARSKDKRNDRPLVTLGLVVDEVGFPKVSKIFKGNISEGKTLLEMIESLQAEKIERKDDKKNNPKARRGITVILDAGIAIEENITLLKKEGYDYICVARNKPVDFSEINTDDLYTIKKDKKNKIEVALIEQNQESVLYCKSLLKEKKEKAMRTQLQHRFEQELKKIATSITKKNGTKKYDKVLERIGRKKEKYSSIAQYYEIDVKQKDGIATDVKWDMEKKERADQHFSGSYFLRTSRTDLSKKEIWSLYVTLNTVEDSFRYLKDDLEIHPVHHQKKLRVNAHLFSAVLAYHLLISIYTELQQHGITMRWKHVRDLLASQVRITTSMNNKQGERIYMRSCSEPEPFHRKIYKALGLKLIPLKHKRSKI